LAAGAIASDDVAAAVSRFTTHREDARHQKARAVYRLRAARAEPGATIAGMLEELDALTAKLTELSGHVRLLRDENQQLRTQLTTAHTQLDELRARVEIATQRLDALIDKLPADTAPDVLR
jgi:predicted  nucleic acid-binding Zn-ribbon protein